jgi:hypothetical protein
MGNILTREKLDELGLENLEPGETERLGAPVSLAGQALGLREAIMLTALLQSTTELPPFLSSACQTLEARGATVAFLSENPNIVRIQTTQIGRDISVKFGTQGAGQRSDDLGSVYWDRTLAPAMVLVLPSGVVAFESHTDGIEVQAVDPVLQLRRLADVQAPLKEWASACVDVWLAAELGRNAEIGGSWHMVVGSGMLARLYEGPSAEAAHPFHLAARAADTELWWRPRTWARALSYDQRQTISDLALAEADAVHLAIDAIAGVLSPDAGPWLSDWKRICYRRDDLASASLILAASGTSDERLTASLAVLDRAGRRTLFNVPSGVVVEDERLRRIRLLDPLAWWGSPENFESLL